MTKIIVTGGCGFIGHHFVEHLCINTDWDIIILDKLSYASMGFERMRDTQMFDLYAYFSYGVVRFWPLNLQIHDF